MKTIYEIGTEIEYKKDFERTGVIIGIKPIAFNRRLYEIEVLYETEGTIDYLDDSEIARATIKEF